MLVLSRKKGETIRIGPDITVTVVEITKDGKVRLGFAAPESVGIWRQELWAGVQEQQREAAREGAR